MTRLYVALQLLVLDLTDPERRSERGQGTLEYVGMVAVACLMIVAVIGALKAFNVGSWITTQVTKVQNLVNT